jgi:multidrug efflux system membrane fusion protein
MKKSYLLALLITVGAVAWVVSGMVMPKGDKTDAAPDAAPHAEKGPLQVRVRDSRAEPMTAQAAVTGRSQAARRVEMKSEIAGQVEAIVVKKGEAVKKGDVIARLEQADRAARAAEARERVKQREIEHNAARELQAKGFNSRVKLAQSAAELQAAKAERHRAELDLENTKIVAPFDGVIADQMIEVGDYAEIGKVTFIIVELDPIELGGFVTERQVSSITAGSPVKAVLLNGMEVEGTLTYVAPTADPATRTFAIEVEVPNPDRRIVEGMTASLRIPMAAVDAHRIAPSSLTLDDKGRVGVKTVGSDNKVSFVPVAIIADEADSMWVAGLPETVRIITVGQDYAAQGQVVVPVPEDVKPGKTQ